MSTPSGAARAETSTAFGGSFAELGVPADLVAVLERDRISVPFEIQTATIPDAMAGRDVLGRAPTGSGKTLAFGIPLVASLEKAKPRRPTAMILSPTRELAEQIRRELAPLAAARDRSLLAIYGGVGFRDQLMGLRRGADLIVACPGRLQDLIDQGEIFLDAVASVVVDEADRMADMGFLPAVRRLLDLTGDHRQTVLFSATLGPEVKVLTDRYQRHPVTHEVGEIEPDLSLVDHRFICTEKMVKVPLAARVIGDAGPTIVFCRTRHGVDRVARQLKNAGVKAGWIHGGRSQNQRDAALHAFTTGRVKALVATDVAARGIHVDGVACVIHFDPPEDDKAYVHRSGRTARAGAGGAVVSFVNSDQLKETRKLQRQLGLPDAIEEAPSDLEPVGSPANRRATRKSADARRQTRPAKGATTKSARGVDPPTRTPRPRFDGRDSEPRKPSRRGSDDERKPGSRRAGAAAASSGGEAKAEEAFNDWTPRKKRSGRPGSKPGSKRRRDGGPTGQSNKRSGKPRPKNKSKGQGAAKATHRKGGGANSASSGSSGR